MAIAQVVTEALAVLRSNKDLVEIYARDIKRQFRPEEVQYTQARQSYESARLVNDTYVAGIQLAVTSDEQEYKDEQRAKELQIATSEFLTVGTRALAPQAVVRKIPFAAVTRTPSALHLAVRRLPVENQTHAIGKLEETRWKPWDEVR
jgi:hypothetical protein